MNISLNTEDRQKFDRLGETLEQNNRAVRLLGAYLSECPDFITAEMMDNICGTCDLPEEEAFCNLLLAACGLDVETNLQDRYLLQAYIRPAVRKLDCDRYRTNPYYRQISIPEIQLGNWKLTYNSYKPYEAFVCADIISDEDFREVPQIGFMDTGFSFPAVMENGVEWMAIKPNEIETMRTAIDRAAGNVVTFGLGLGYYAFMVSEKAGVESVTIVEKDREAIALFRTHILPQFPHKDKIDIVREDAFEYAAHRMGNRQYDHAFVDLWHDISDGYPIYLRMKRLERYSPSTTFSYWIEDSLLSHMRWQLFHRMLDFLKLTGPAGKVSDIIQIPAYHRLRDSLQNSFLRKLAGTDFDVHGIMNGCS